MPVMTLNMATQLAERAPHPDLRSAKFGPPHFLEIDLGMQEGISWGGNSFNRNWRLIPFRIAVKTLFFLVNQIGH